MGIYGLHILHFITPEGSRTLGKNLTDIKIDNKYTCIEKS